MSEEKKIPTVEEFLAHLNEQIQIAEARERLQALNTSIAKNRAEELNALAFIAQVTNPQPDNSSDALEEEVDEEVASPKRKLKKD